MKKLLQHKNYHWDLDGIEFAIEERVGMPENFIGRVEELEYLYGWTSRIQQKLSKSTAFLGRRKVGKTLILERLYNILYSEQKGLIPFYYEFTEGERDGKEFYRDFTTRFYMQVVGYYTRDINWIRRAVDKKNRPVMEAVLQEVEQLEFKHKDIIVYEFEDCLRVLQTNSPPYEYVISAVAAPAGFATTVGVEDQVVQMIDEFQYLNKHIDAGVVDKPCMAYMGTAESKVAPLLITGSLMGVVSEDLMRWLPQRFSNFFVPKMKPEEAKEMTLNYGQSYGYPITPEIAEYIVYITNGIPGRIVELLPPKMGKPAISSLDDVDRALEFEVGIEGTIKYDWDEYLSMAMDKVNDVHMRRITYFLCKNEGTRYYPSELKEAMSLDIDDQQLRRELELLFKYDIIELRGGRYGGVFDRTLKKVLMVNYADLFNLPDEDFDVYFKNDNMLDYLKERAERLELSLAEARELRKKLARLQGQHNNLKGHYYEREVLLRLIKAIIDGDGGLVEGISVTAFNDNLNYHLTTGEEIDIVLDDEHVVIMAECKNYAPDNLDKITPKMVDEFVDKANWLHQADFAKKELRLGFFSKHGFQKSLADYLTKRGMVFF
ncbi:hypothetical protein QUF64_09995 [Anaerolineales bacterium HSG6]|nr:hypothetical protein [Anaerolineales bacterium HSG6]